MYAIRSYYGHQVVRARVVGLDHQGLLHRGLRRVEVLRPQRAACGFAQARDVQGRLGRRWLGELDAEDLLGEGARDRRERGDQRVVVALTGGVV